VMFPVVFLLKKWKKRTRKNYACEVPYHRKGQKCKCKLMCKCDANVMQMWIASNLFVHMQCECEFQFARWCTRRDMAVRCVMFLTSTAVSPWRA
jgi:hypothetical protein